MLTNYVVFFVLLALLKKNKFIKFSVQVNSLGKLTFGKLAARTEWLATLQYLLHA